MKATYFFLVLLFITKAWGQNETQPSQNSFNLKLGVGYRISPVNLSRHTGSIFDPNVPVYYERDKQLTGTSLLVGGFYLLRKQKIAISLLNSFRYDHVYFKSDFNQAVGEEKKAFISDIHLGISKFISLKNNHKQFQLGLGFSFMNNGTDYYYVEKSVAPSGDTVVFEFNSDFSYKTFDLLMGYQVNQFSFELVNRFSLHHKFNDKGQLYLPEIRVGYSIGLRRRTIL